MKNIKLLFYVFSFLLILSSCGSDDDDDDTNENTTTPILIGTWKLTEQEGDVETVTTYNNPDAPITSVTRNTTQVITSSNFIKILKENMEYEISGSINQHASGTSTTLTSSGEETTEPYELDFIIQVQPGTETGAWELNEDQLTESPLIGEPQTGTILEHTENKYKINQIGTITIFESQEVTIIGTFDLVSTYERQ